MLKQALRGVRRFLRFSRWGDEPIRCPRTRCPVVGSTRLTTRRRSAILGVEFPARFAAGGGARLVFLSHLVLTRTLTMPFLYYVVAGTVALWR